MFKPHTVLGFGLWLIAVSFFGISSTWKIRIYIATGALFVLIHLYHLGRKAILGLAKEGARTGDTFVENGHIASHAELEKKK